MSAFRALHQSNIMAELQSHLEPHGQGKVVSGYPGTTVQGGMLEGRWVDTRGQIYQTHH